MGFIYILTHLFSFSSSLPFASCQSYYITLISGQAPGNLHPAQIKSTVFPPQVCACGFFMLFPILSSIPKAVLKSTKDLMFFFLDRERCCPTLLQMQSFTNTHGCFDGENFSWSIPSISTFSTWMSVFSPFNSTLIYNSLWRGAFFSFISIPLSIE